MSLRDIKGDLTKIVDISFFTMMSLLADCLFETTEGLTETKASSLKKTLSPNKTIKQIPKPKTTAIISLILIISAIPLIFGI